MFTNVIHVPQANMVKFDATIPVHVTINALAKLTNIKFSLFITYFIIIYNTIFGLRGKNYFTIPNSANIITIAINIPAAT